VMATVATMRPGAWPDSSRPGPRTLLADLEHKTNRVRPDTMRPEHKGTFYSFEEKAGVRRSCRGKVECPLLRTGDQPCRPFL
jgi:hypothetical protein